MKKKTVSHSSHSNGGTTAQFQQILTLYENGKSIRDIAFIVDMPRSTVHRWITNNSVPFSCSGSSQTKFEIHNYHVTFDILEKPHGWQPNAILHLKKQKFEVIQRNGWEEYYFSYNNCSIHITPSKIIFYPPRIQSKVSIMDAKIMATQTALELISRLEQHLEIKISSRPCTVITIARQHAVMINDNIWDALKTAGFTKITDEKGKIRLMLDESNGKHIESTHPQQSDNDIEKFNNLVKETVIGGCSFFQTNKALVTTQQAILSMNERLVRLESDGVQQKSEVDPDPSYIG